VGKKKETTIHLAIPEETPSSNYPFVLVEWIDSRSMDGWLRQSELETTPANIRSVGWIVAESENSIVLAGTSAPELDQFAGMMVIPKCCLTKRIDLVWPNP